MAEGYFAQAQELANALKSVPLSDLQPYFNVNAEQALMQRWFKLISVQLITLRVTTAKRSRGEQLIMHWLTEQGVPIIKQQP